jgi:hypothetical protein
MERIDVTGSHEAEVAVIQGSELGLVEALDDGEDGGVDEADVGVGVTVAKVTDADVVLRLKVFDQVGAGGDVV